MSLKKILKYTYLPCRELPQPSQPSPPSSVYRSDNFEVSQNLNFSEHSGIDSNFYEKHVKFDKHTSEPFGDNVSESRYYNYHPVGYRQDPGLQFGRFVDNICEFEENYESSSAEFECDEFSETLSVDHRYNLHSQPQSARQIYNKQQYNQMGEEKRLFLTNSARGGVDTAPSTAGYGGVGSRLLQRNKNTGGKRLSAPVGSAGINGRDNLNGGAGDSDGMMGSGGESDSSEEIHYGPGFVSRLKSRYMSVALRGSPRGSLGTLRRTASLEDFLDLTESEPRVQQPEVSPMLKYTHRINQPTQRVTPTKVSLFSN